MQILLFYIVVLFTAQESLLGAVAQIKWSTIPPGARLPKFRRQSSCDLIWSETFCNVSALGPPASIHFKKIKMLMPVMLGYSAYFWNIIAVQLYIPSLIFPHPMATASLPSWLTPSSSYRQTGEMLLVNLTGESMVINAISLYLMEQQNNK